MSKQMIDLIHKIIRTAGGAAAAFTAVCMLSLTVYAYTQTTGTVIPATAKIRAEANTTSSVVGSTAAGKTVTITDEVTGSDGSAWYQVIVDASTKGYIRSDLVKKADGSAAAPADQTVKKDITSSASTEMKGQAGKVTPKSVNVRNASSPTADVVARVVRGTVVTVTAKAADSDGKEWYKVSFTYDGATVSGYIRADLITFGELPDEEPAVTEITGTKDDGAEAGNTLDAGADTPPETTQDPAGEGNTEAVSGNEAQPDDSQEGSTGDIPQSTGLKVKVMTTEETPKLADGFKEVSINKDGEKIRAWKNGDFYIFYAQSDSGDAGYYLYDSVDGTYQRYYLENVLEDPAAGKGINSNTLKIILIILAIIVVALLVVITLLTVKLNNIRTGRDWEDDYSDDEEADEEPEEDTEEEEELPVRRMKKKPVSKPVQPPESTQTKKRVSRNFLEVEEEPEVIRPLDDDMDPDDEDTFVFINLDGDKID